MVVSLPDEARDSRHRTERARDSNTSWFGAGGWQRSRGSGVETPVWVTCHPSPWTLQCMGHFLKTLMGRDARGTHSPSLTPALPQWASFPSISCRNSPFSSQKPTATLHPPQSQERGEKNSPWNRRGDSPNLIWGKRPLGRDWHSPLRAAAPSCPSTLHRVEQDSVGSFAPRQNWDQKVGSRNDIVTLTQSMSNGSTSSLPWLLSINTPLWGRIWQGLAERMAEKCWPSFLHCAS